MHSQGFREGRYNERVDGAGATPGPLAGMGVARKLGMTCYRSRIEFDGRFDWSVRAGAGVGPSDATTEVESYMDYQVGLYPIFISPTCI